MVIFYAYFICISYVKQFNIRGIHLGILNKRKITFALVIKADQVYISEWNVFL